jgi:hypothetical protein
MSTDPNDLPQWHGRPVPWVTRWTGEISPTRYDIAADENGDFTYIDGQNLKDAKGILWQREGIGRNGDPDWASVSTYRQRASIAKRKCQVCGNKIKPGSIQWLMPLDEGYIETGEGGMLTWNPPTCEDCIPLALELCPHLKRNGYQILKVLDYEVWGVMGLTITRIGDQPYPLQAARAYNEEDDLLPKQIPAGQIMAQQMVAKLGTFIVDEVVPGSRPQETPEDIEQQARNFLRNLVGDDEFERLEAKRLEEKEQEAIDEDIRSALWEDAVANGEEWAVGREADA